MSENTVACCDKFKEAVDQCSLEWVEDTQDWSVLGDYDGSYVLEAITYCPFCGESVIGAGRYGRG